MHDVLASPDALAALFAQLAPHELLAVARVNATWRDVATSNLLWQPIVRRLLHKKNNVPKAALSAPSLVHTYIAALSSRSLPITDDHLVNSEWRLDFNDCVVSMHLTDEEKFSRPQLWATFHEDGRFSSSAPGAPSASRTLNWANNQGCVRVGSYPVLIAQRDAHTWGWVLENRFVTLTQVAPVELATLAASRQPASPMSFADIDELYRNLLDEQAKDYNAVMLPPITI